MQKHQCDTLKYRHSKEMSLYSAKLNLIPETTSYQTNVATFCAAVYEVK